MRSLRDRRLYTAHSASQFPVNAVSQNRYLRLTRKLDGSSCQCGASISILFFPGRCRTERSGDMSDVPETYLTSPE